MLISFNWLGRHIDLGGLSPAQVAADLTLRTAEVEGVEEFLPHARSIVVGKVLAREPHTKADRLSLCRVDVGGPEPLPIVCGAANVAAGQTVPVALPGTSLPGIGKLVLVERAPREMVMRFGPMAGQTVKVPKKKVLKFRVAKAAKDAILGPKK